MLAGRCTQRRVERGVIERQLGDHPAVVAELDMPRLEITGGRLVLGFGGAINRNARTLPSLLAVGTPVAGDFPTN